MPRPNASRLFVLALLCAVLSDCARVVPLRETGPTDSIVVRPIDLAGEARPAHWYLPAREATALVVFEHGCTRRCANLRQTTRQIMAAGIMALCVDASMGGGNPALAENATHADVEGEDTDGLTEWDCGPVMPATPRRCADS